MQARLRGAELILGYRFGRPALLAEAMTHRSAVRRGRGQAASNERLEFIGDRVLGLLMAEWLIERFPHEQEGDMGRRLAHLVAMPVLAAIAEQIGLPGMLTLSAGDARAGVASRANVAADAIEAVIGALYLDGGITPARDFVRARWEPALRAQSAPPQDAKTTLQEWAQARGHALPRYRVVARTGPSHAPIFEVAVRVDGGEVLVGEATGSAASKREAERLAAQALLARLVQKPGAPGGGV